jgi:hypothetical protein
MLITTILLVFSIAFLFQAVFLPMGTLKNIGPGLYPTILSIVMIILLLVQFLREIKFPSMPKLTVTRYQLIFIILLGLFILFLENAGYLVVGAVFCFLFSMVLGWQLKQAHNDESSLKIYLVLPLVAAVLITGVDYILFEIAFDFHLP